MKYKLHKIYMILAGFALAAPSLPAALILHYDFNNVTGGSQALDGSVVTDVSGNNLNGAVRAPTTGSYESTTYGPTWTVDGVGASGLAGDYAFSNTKALMGSQYASTGGSIRIAGLGSSSLTSLTVSLWFNLDTAATQSGTAIIFDNGVFEVGLRNSQLVLWVKTDSGLATGANTSLALNLSETDLIGVGKWTFLALTYDGTDTDGLNSLNVYLGSSAETASVVLTNTTSISGSIASGKTWIDVGGNANKARHLDALIDDIQVYGATSGASGALSADDLNNYVRQFSTVPEPAGIAVTIGGLVLLASFVVRRQRKQ